MLSLLFKGLLIGVLVSAPMGPVGTMCVRRTMRYGQRAGLLTGLGATASDLFYATVTLLGIGVFIDFIEQYREPFSLVGSVGLILFSLYVAFSTHSLSPNEHEVGRPNMGRWHRWFYLLLNSSSDFARFISAFLLTLSNVAILFFYVMLFAQFSIVVEDGAGGFVWLPIVGIGIGALLWWSFVTWVILLIKQYFNVRSLKKFNRVVGAILFIIGVAGVVSSLIALCS